MPRYTTVLFDFGATLADVHPHHEWLYVKACREFGVELDPARAGVTDEFGWEAFMTPEGPAHPQMSASAEAFARHKKAILVDRLTRMGVTEWLEEIAGRVYQLDTDPVMYRLFDDTVPALERLRAEGYSMGLLSNHEWDLPLLIEGLGLAPYFGAILTSARVGVRKPHPRMFLAALEQLGRRPAEAIMVGDSLSSDVAGAQRLGMGAVLVDRAGRHRGVEAVRVIRTLSQLPDILVE